jgi:filamentous hemagglutinin family protein
MMPKPLLFLYTIQVLVIPPIVAGIASGQAIAQPITPAIDGTNTRVTVRGNQFDIDGGQLSRDGVNLFQSFRQFGLDANQIANFISKPSIQNILGRVTGGDPSVINGLIQVTGGQSNLYLLNPSGILFGPNARLSIPASFLATTATGIEFSGGWFNAIASNDYASLVGSPTTFAFNAAQAGSIVNAGQLAVSEGQSLSLLGGTVVNTGSLSAPAGQITIMAVPSQPGEASLLRISQPGNLLSLEIVSNTDATTSGASPLPSDFQVASLPQLLTGGNFGSATRLTVDAAGQVALMTASSSSSVQIPSETGTAIASGAIAASGSSLGGTVQILGNQVALLGADVNVSGVNGGGTVLLGGDYRGQGPLPTANQTYISNDSTIVADGLLNGNGGRVIAWAEQGTQFYGTISAQGGSNTGDGGFVEVSGRENLAFNGTVRVGAVNGSDGTLLLDPQKIIIASSQPPGTTVPTPPTPPANIFNTPANANDIYYINDQALENFTGNITLEATDQIRYGAADFGNPALDQSLSRQNLIFGTTPGNTVTLTVTNPDNALPESSFGGVILPFRFLGTSPVARAIVTRGGNLVINGGTNATIRTDGGNLTYNASPRFLGQQTGDVSTAPLITKITADGPNAFIVYSGDTGGFGFQTQVDSTRPAGSINFNYDSVLTIGSLNASGSTGGNITVQARSIAQDGLSRADSSSTGLGQAGNITITTTVPFTGQSSLRLGDIDAHSEGGTGGTVTINSADRLTVNSINVSGQGFDLSTGNSTSFNPPGPAGNVEITAPTLTFKSVFAVTTAPGGPGGNIAVKTDRLVSDTSTQIGFFRVDGQLSIQPITPNQTIALGGNVADPNALNLADNTLNAFFTAPNPFVESNRIGGGIVLGGTGWNGNIVVSRRPDRQGIIATPVTIISGGNANLTGPDADTTYTFTGSNTGTIGGLTINSSVPDVVFQNVGRIITGAGNNTFTFPNNTSFNGDIDASKSAAVGNNDVIDLSAYTSALDVDLNRPTATDSRPAIFLANNPNFRVINGTTQGINGVFGGQENDSIRGDSTRASILFGGGGSDTIIGGSGNDTLSGGPTGGPGSPPQVIDGGGGFNRLVETEETDFTLENPNSISRGGTLAIGSNIPANTETFTNIDFITLRAQGSNPRSLTASNWTGTELLLLGGTGPDTITTSNLTGRVFADGGAGADIYNIGLSGNGITNVSDSGVGVNDIDTLNVTGNPNSSYDVSTQAIRLIGSNQLLTVQGIEQQFITGAGNDTYTVHDITSPDDNFTIRAGVGSNVATVSNNLNGRVTFEGNTGDDTVTVNLNGRGFGRTIISPDPGGNNQLTINGTPAADILLLANGQVNLAAEAVTFDPPSEKVTVNGGLGDDTFRFRDNQVNFNGTIDGGAGSNTLDYSNYTTPVIANLTTSAVPGGVTLVPGTLQNIIGGSADDNLTGDSQNNRLDGRGGNDTLNGVAGDDTLIGGLGINTLDGGTGTNTVLETRDANFNLTNSSLTLSDGSSDTLTSIQNATLTGGAGNNTFTIAPTWTGNATLNGLEGSDTYTVNTNPTSTGAIAVTDTGTTGSDALTVNAPAGNNAIAVSTGNIRVNSETVTYAGSESQAVNGNTGDDTFTVSNLRDAVTLNGGDGSDAYTVNFVGAGAGTTTIQDSGTTGTNSLTANGTTGNDRLTVTATQITDGSEAINRSNIQTLSVNGGNGASDSIRVNEALNQTGNLTFNAETITTAPTANLTVGTLTATGGTLDLNAPVTATAGNVTATATTTLTAGSITASGDINTRATTTLTTDDLTAGGQVIVNGRTGVTVGDVTAPAGITLTSRGGSVQSGNLTSAADTQAGKIQITAGDRITTGQIDSSSSAGSGGRIDLRGDAITTGRIDSSSSAGSGGRVNLQGNGIRVVTINAQGATPATSGDVQVGNDKLPSNALFQATGTFRANNGVRASIAGRNITIFFNSDTTPFTIGDARQNGTAGALVSGANNTISSLTVPNRLQQGNISVINLGSIVVRSSLPNPLPPSINPDVIDRPAIATLFLPVCPAAVSITIEAADGQAQSTATSGSGATCSPITGVQTATESNPTPFPY